MTPWLTRVTSRLQASIDQMRRREGQMTMVLSVVIGALVGLVVVAFVAVTGRVANHFYPTGAADWRRIAMPILGALVSGWLLFRYFPDARGSGIPQTKAAFFLRDGEISARTALGKFLCCSISLGSGIALGREGPAVQIGAGIASVLSRRLGLSKETVRSLIPVGAAAALAAAFNTPIAAVLFALEEVVGNLHAPVLGGVVLSSATSWMVLHLLLGDEPLFHVAPYHLDHPAEFIGYAVLGVVGGLVSVLFVKLLLRLRLWFQRWQTTHNAWAQPMIGGATVGLMAFFVPDVMGVGYPTVEHVLAGDMVLQIVILLAVLKIIATAVCYASGNAGGIFGPSLFIGAMCGAAVGHLLQIVAPGHSGAVGAFALVGMGTIFAGVVRTPMTSVIMIFELTRDYAIIVPLMLSNLIAFLISQKLQPEPIYEALAHQDGIHLPEVMPRDTPTHLRIGTVMQRVSATEPPPLQDDVPHVHPDQALSVALERLAGVPDGVLQVVSRVDAKRVLGTVTVADALRGYGLEK